MKSLTTPLQATPMVAHYPRDNVAFVESFNANKNNKFWLGVNQFADLTTEEFKANKGFKPTSAEKVPTTGFKYENLSVSALPTAVDWRTKGAVTPIKNQGQCGCCWAFSAVAAMEGIVKLSTGNLISLSKQELVDCDTHSMDEGCEVQLPYKAVDGKCKGGSKSAATIKGHEDVPVNNEAALMKAVANQPVSVAVDASDRTFMLYSGGVMTGSCGTELDHGIAAIGYGMESDGTKYWILKNSWGTTWGEKGFLRMEKDITDKRGMCGLAMKPSYPTE
ncbi:hypothetical protein BDA96_06G024600 [Sorghum bicolor]|uniref:Peptidase C1A papain C-terminal domain-containing protein n=2 Tax=Sorghum bicolor TaxID=4558 RepID=A0A1Z5RBS2_SORBI|nr:hypothetical protein BDA96_06G024600 [Sorghum bicolor]OQU81188.1 hypothetical protein SORBI_3006G023000 [Sorghum bicolor]